MLSVNGIALGSYGSVIVDDGQTWTYQPETITNAQPATQPQLSWQAKTSLPTHGGRGEVCPHPYNLSRIEAGELINERPTGAANKGCLILRALAPPCETNQNPGLVGCFPHFEEKGHFILARGND